MKKISIYLILCCLLTPVFSICQKLDSLESLLKKETNLRKKVELLNLISWEKKYSDPKEALNYALQAQKIAVTIKDSLGLSFSLNNIALYFKNIGSYDSALKYYKNSLGLRLSLKDTLNICRSYINLINIYKAKGKIPEAIKLGEKAKSLFTQIGEDSEKATLLNNLGPLYIQVGDFERALKSYLVSLEIRKKQQNIIGVANVYLNIGNYYDIVENRTKALHYFKSAEVIFAQRNSNKQLAKVYNNIGNIYYSQNQLGKASDYYEKSLELKKQLGAEEDIFGAYLNLGRIAEQLKDFKKALDLFKKSIKGYKSFNNSYKVCEISLLIVNLFLEQNKYASALIYLEQANQILTDIDAPVLQIEVYYYFYRYYEKVKEFNTALLYLNKSIHLKDSIEENVRNSQKVYTNYLEEQKKNIELQKNIAEKNALISKSHANNKIKILIGSSVVIGLLGLVIFLFLHNKNKKLKLKALESEKKELRSKEILRKILERQEEKSINALFKGQESERKRIAQDLHDRLGSLLTSVKLYFKSMDDDITKIQLKNEEQYSLLNKLIDEAIQEVRRISNDLASGVLVKYGLPEALNELCKTIEKAGQVKVNLIVHGLQKRLEYILEVQLYRVVQELLTNCIKHANAKEIVVQIICSDSQLVLMVEDDGSGFKYDNDMEKGMGLSNVQERVDLIKGELEIDTGLSNGTTITVKIDL